jgi:hypothetical protein
MTGMNHARACLRRKCMSHKRHETDAHWIALTAILQAYMALTQGVKTWLMHRLALS